MSTTSTGRGRLAARSVTLGYGERVVARDLDLVVPDGAVTALIGPNACGKSTALRALARLLRPLEGTVVLDGSDLHARPAREVARIVGLLPQQADVPDGITVYQLVARGRFPHQGLFRQWSDDDERAVTSALERCRLADLADRVVGNLSGGQRQRVRIAMVLAQETDLLLLDEPTTYLDLAHQVEVLDLVRRLNRDEGTTVVAVLHDVNQAARYADHLVALRDGRVVVSGPPGEVLTAEVVQDVFGLACRVVPDPETGTPLVVPLAPDS